MNEVRSGLLTAGEHIAGALRERIISGELAAGTPLALTGLAKEFGVSMNPVRDALRELEREGLVEGRAMLGHRVSHLDGKAIFGLWKLREAIEVEAARMCAGRLTKAQAAELGHLSVIADDKGDGDLSFDEHEVRFHRRITEMADCPELLATLDRTHTLLGTFFRPWFKKMNMSHLELVREIATGDPDRADRAVRKHVELRAGDLEKLMALRARGARGLAGLERPPSPSRSRIAHGAAKTLVALGTKEEVSL